MRSKIDPRRAVRSLYAIGEQVVERHAAARLLQAVDAAETRVVENNDNQLLVEHDRCRDLGIEHQITAVADDHDNLSIGLRHLYAEAASDLVAHARVAV